MSAPGAKPTLKLTSRPAVREWLRKWECPDRGVRREHEEPVVGLEHAGEEADLLHRARERGSADDLDIVADAKGPEPQQHDARRDVGERPLQGEADRKARGAERGEEGGGLHADLAQRRDERSR